MKKLIYVINEITTKDMFFHTKAFSSYEMSLQNKILKR